MEQSPAVSQLVVVVGGGGEAIIAVPLLLEAGFLQPQLQGWGPRRGALELSP